MYKIIFFAALVILPLCSKAQAYQQLNIEPRDQYEYRRGGYKNSYENAPHEYITTEAHYCNRNRHNTSYEDHCYDIYFKSDGSIVWYRRKFKGVTYNDVLRGNYYLQQSGHNRYDLIVTWNNGSKARGYVRYSTNNTKPHLVLYDHIFDCK